VRKPWGECMAKVHKGGASGVVKVSKYIAGHGINSACAQS